MHLACPNDMHQVQQPLLP